MITDASLIKILLNRDNYNKYCKFIHEDALSDDTRTILRDLKAFYGSTTTTNVLTVDQLSTYFHHVRHPEYKDSQHIKFKEFFNQISLETDSELIEKIINHYQKENLYYKLESLCLNRASISDLENEFLQYKDTERSLVDQNCASNKFEDIFYNVQNVVGLQWPLECLNRSIGPIRKGHLGLIAAYVHMGKTAFMCQLAAFMANQLKEDECVLYFNNEGPNDEVQMRICQSLLDLPLDQIIKDIPQAEKRYINILSHRDKIKVIDANSLTIHDIGEMAKTLNAGLVIIDQLANLIGTTTKDGNEATRLKKLSREVSALSIKQCPVIASHQCDASVVWHNRETGKKEGQHYIKMNQLDSSKIHLPGACNYIITIGFDYEYPQTRYIHVPKNRLPHVKGMIKEDRFVYAQVQVDWERVRYIDNE